MKNGGTRPGAGRPKLHNEGWKTVSISWPPSLLRAIDRVAGKMGRSAWVRDAVRRRLEKDGESVDSEE